MENPTLELSQDKSVVRVTASITDLIHCIQTEVDYVDRWSYYPSIVVRMRVDLRK